MRISTEAYIPVVNIFYDAQSHCFTMSFMQIVCYPSHKVVFKGSFDELMQKVRCEKLVDVCLWKSMCERLTNGISK
jgi:hypothetical protein